VHEIDKATSILSFVNGLGPIFETLKNKFFSNTAYPRLGLSVCPWQAFAA
jgi:hypothetical protein